METIEVKGREFEMTTLTKVDIVISREIAIFLEYEYNLDFVDGFCDIYSNNQIKLLLEDKDELSRVVEEYSLSDEDIEDLQCLVEILDKVDFIQLEIAL